MATRMSQDRMKDEPEAPPPPGDDPLRRFSALSGDWFWVQDAQLRLTYLSSRLSENSGIDLALYLGARRWEQPALNLTQTDWDRHRAQVERHEAFKDFEIQCLTDDGRTLWLSLSAQPLLDEDGSFSGYLGVGRDVTHQKRIEQLRALEHGVARAIAEGANVVESVQAMKPKDGTAPISGASTKAPGRCAVWSAGAARASTPPSACTAARSTCRSSPASGLPA
jgi:PAS domain S-box-containing protein